MNFKPIVPSDFPKLKIFFQRQQYRLCAYSLPSIIAWNSAEFQPYAAVDGKSLIVSGEFATRLKNRHLMLPVSLSKDYPPLQLHDLAVKLKFDKYWFVPEDYLQQYGKAFVESFFEVKEQKNFEDYIYATDDLALLKGNRYSSKRNLIHQFERYYVDRGRVTIEKMVPAVLSECIDFLEKWCEERNCDINEDEELFCERQAAINTIENIDLFELDGILLRIDGEINAFGIASRLTENMGVLHFEKAFASKKGLYQYFDRECARRFFKGCSYINKESDMNVPGLAKAKKSYHPVMTVKSYMLTVR
jgi:hypothetical protein